LVYLCAVTSSLTSILLGYDVGVMSGAILNIAEDLDLGTVQQEIIVGSLNLIAAFGGLVAGKLADQLGRRSAIGVACCIFIAGSLLKILSSHFWMLLSGRVVTGVGVGCGFVVAPVYISEITPPKLRGRLVALTDISINLGILIGYLTAYGVQVGVRSGPGARWRLMLGVSLAPPVVILACLLFLPESPRWLVAQGRRAEGLAVLRRVLPPGGAAEAALADIEGLVREEGRAAGWREVLLSSARPLRRVVGVVLGLGFWQQASGSESVIYYTPIILRRAGMASTRQVLLGNLLVGGCKLGGELACALLVERAGRRPLLLASAALQTLCLFAVAAAVGAGSSAGLDLFLLAAFMWWFSFGLGPVTWVSAAELTPLSVRSKALASAVFLNRAVSGTVALSFLSLSDALSIPGAFIFYGCLSLASVAFYYLRVPETKGKSLEEIQRALFPQLEEQQGDHSRSGDESAEMQSSSSTAAV